MTIPYYSRHRIPIMHRQFFGKLSQNRDYKEKICTNLSNPLQYACLKWYNYNNPQY